MMEKGFVTFIEWDGDKAPTAFYHRLRRLTSGVRGDKSVSPVARRAERNKTAVIVQEGAIYCSDEQLARAIAILAEKYGARMVQVGTVMNMANVIADEADLQALKRIEDVCGQRGRPTKDDQRQANWEVFCYHEMKIYDVENSLKPICCPECGSFMSDVHRYGANAWNHCRHSNMESDYTLIDVWYSLRFQGNKIHPFVPCDIELKSARKCDRFSDEGIIASVFRKIVEEPLVSINWTWLDAFCESPSNGIRILDAIYLSRWQVRPERRQRDRITAIASILQNNQDITIPQIAERDNALDFFDAASMLDEKTMLSLFSMIREYCEGINQVPDFYQVKVL